MSDLPLYVAAFVVVIGVLIVVHELGHYLVARLCGVKVLRFSVGFGKVLWQRQLGPDRTEWAIGLFPLGGYVKMLDEREGDVVPEERHRAFNRQTVGRRSMIVAAGPLANFLAAVVLYWIVFMSGSQELLPVLGTPPAGTPAALSSIANGDLVRSVDGEPVVSWTDFRWLLLKKAVDHESVELEIINERDEIAFRRLYLAAAGEAGWEGDVLARLGVVFYRPNLPPVFGKVVKGGAGDRAGLLAGDEVLAVDGMPVSLWHELVARIREAPGRSLQFEIQRQDSQLFIDVIPDEAVEQGRKLGKIGVAVADHGERRRDLRTFVSYGFFEAGGRALSETWEKTVFSLTMMGKMLTGEVSLKNLSGPVTIADYAGQSAKLGVDYYLKFMALVSISLGILNLLPIPVLDGGHLLYHMLEVIRRRPLSERAMEIAQQLGVSILFVLMAFAFYNDLSRLFFG